MRPCTPASLCLAAAAALLPGSAATALAAPVDTGPACAAAGDSAFPLTTRIHGGPASYEAGGGYGIWYLDLTNTTDRSCSGIHPVVVLVDQQHALKPTQPRLEFYDGVRPLPVPFETTDEAELVGAFGAENNGADTFPGFTVGPRATVTVKIRLALTSDAAPNQVTVNAAVVQRHEDDGDWVGESNAYSFRIEAETDSDSDSDADSDSDSDTDTDAGTDSGTDTDTGTGRDPGTHTAPTTGPTPAAPTSRRTPAPDSPSAASTPRDPGASPHATPTPTGTALTVPGTAPTGSPTPEDDVPFADQLAGTGLGVQGAVLAATLALLAAGGVLVLVRRRR